MKATVAVKLQPWRCCFSGGCLGPAFTPDGHIDSLFICQAYVDVRWTVHSGYSANHSMTWAVGVHLQECTRYRPVSIEQMVHTEPSAEQSTTRPAGEHMDEFESFDTKSFVGRLLGKGDWGGFMDKIKVGRGVPDAMTAHRVAVLPQQSACPCSCHDSGCIASLRPDQSLAQPQCLQDMPCSLCLLWRKLACCTTGQSEAGVETPGTMLLCAAATDCCKDHSASVR